LRLFSAAQSYKKTLSLNKTIVNLMLWFQVADRMVWVDPGVLRTGRGMLLKTDTLQGMGNLSKGFLTEWNNSNTR
jgi:hypothetical protein